MVPRRALHFGKFVAGKIAACRVLGEYLMTIDHAQKLAVLTMG
jgi:hypothetical protein